MEIVTQLNQWWNLIFVLPFALGVIFVVLSVLGTGGRRSGSRHPGRTTSTARVPIKNAGHRGVYTSRTQAGHAHSVAHGRARITARARITGRRQSRSNTERLRRGKNGFSLSQVRIVQVDNLPPLMLLQNFLLFWGIFGWAANQYFVRILPDPGRFIILSLLTAGISSLIVTIALSAVLSRFTPTDETYAVTKRDLVGKAGEAISTVTHRMGSVYVRDDSGTLHHLPVRVQSGRDSIPKGRGVLVIDYEAEGDFFWVKEWLLDKGDWSDSWISIEPPHGTQAKPLQAQTARPYRAWRWLVGSNPPSLFLSSRQA